MKLKRKTSVQSTWKVYHHKSYCPWNRI